MKLIDRSFSVNGNINPSIFDILKITKDERALLFCEEHVLQHPLGIYNRSMMRISNCFKRLSSYIKNDSRYGSDDSEELFHLTKDLTDSVIAFRDDLYTIIKCYIPAAKCAKTKQPIFVDKWIEQTEYSKFVIDFKSKQNVYLGSIQKIHNEIKHNNGRLSYIKMRTGFFSVFGFFLENIIGEKKTIDKTVHPMFNNVNTGFSYNYFLLLCLCATYYLGQDAMHVLKEILCIHNIPPVEDSSSQTTEMIEAVNKALTSILFYDEYFRDFPQFDFHNSNQVIAMYPANNNYAKRKFVFIPAGRVVYDVTYITKGDGLTREYELPYFIRR